MLAALLLFAMVSLYSPGFANPAHVATLIILASFTGIVAIGQTMVIIGGGIDLSVPVDHEQRGDAGHRLCRMARTCRCSGSMPLILVCGCARRHRQRRRHRAAARAAHRHDHVGQCHHAGCCC